MYARNKTTGSPIVGTLESIEARSDTLENSFSRDAEGHITHEHQGWTEIFWNTAKNVKRGEERLYLDEAGDSVPETDIELTETPPASQAKTAAATAA